MQYNMYIRVRVQPASHKIIGSKVNKPVKGKTHIMQELQRVGLICMLPKPSDLKEAKRKKVTEHEASYQAAVSRF